MTIFERTNQYDTAISFSCLAFRLVERLPEDERFLAEQLSAAAVQLPARIGESTLMIEGISDEERSDAYSSACGVAARCAAIFDLLQASKALEREEIDRARGALREVVDALSR